MITLVDKRMEIYKWNLVVPPGFLHSANIWEKNLVEPTLHHLLKGLDGSFQAAGFALISSTGGGWVTKKRLINIRCVGWLPRYLC